MQHLRKNNLIFGGIFVVTDFKPAWKLPPAARRRRTQLSAWVGSAFLHQLRREIASGGSPAPNPTCGAGRQCVPTQTAARYWVQRHAAVIAEKTLTPNPLSMRAGSAFLHQLRRDIGSSVTQNTKINAEPSRRRGQVVHFCTNCGAILGPASRKIQKLTLNPVVGAGR